VTLRRVGGRRQSIMAALAEMSGNLRNTVSDVRDAAAGVATISAQIAAGNSDLSARTEDQAASLEETASAMEQLTATVKQNDGHAREANQLARNASDIAKQGGAIVEEVVDTMAAINTSSRKIVDIIGVIDGIAFQTNILALNAAVEAARAGEQGRGFAVVATEVRNLAQRSAAAAKEVKQLIDASVNNVETGTRLVERAGETMEQIVASVQQVTDVMGEISAASHEQSLGIEEVNKAIALMDQVTQHNAALVEEATAAVATLQEQAVSLNQAVGVFQLEAPDARWPGTGGNPRRRTHRAAAPLAHRAAPMEARRRAVKNAASGGLLFPSRASRLPRPGGSDPSQLVQELLHKPAHASPAALGHGCTGSGLEPSCKRNSLAGKWSSA
jgi:methyl-accepting chemotaxis protein